MKERGKSLLRKTYRSEVYNYRPSWVLQWGITTSFLFLLLIIAVSGFIKFPDVILASAELTTLNPPVHLLSKIDGKLERVFVKEGQDVGKGDVLAMLASPVDLDHLQALDNYLGLIDSVVKGGKYAFVDPSYFSNKLRLGELQYAYSEVLMTYTKLYSYFHLDPNGIELKLKEDENESEVRYREILKRKKNLLEQQFKLAYQEFSKDSLLYIEGVIPERDFARSRQQNDLQYQSLLADINMGIASSESISTSLTTEIERIVAKDKEARLHLKLQLQQNIRLLRASIGNWEQNHLFISPISGKASFTEYWFENQNVNAGNIVISVLPEEETSIKTRIQFPILNSGKIRPGQRVNIKLENYPFQEFGMLVGEMGDVSKVPNGTFFRADVILPKGLVTTYRDSLPLVQQATGQAEILTDDMSLLMRFLNPLKAVFDERLY